jgi:hypothetical protein
MTENGPQTKKTAISLPKDLLEYLEARRDAGEIPSLSGHIADLLQREQQATEVDATLARLFPGERPGPGHQAWADKALGVTGDAGDKSSAA